MLPWGAAAQQEPKPIVLEVTEPESEPLDVLDDQVGALGGGAFAPSMTTSSPPSADRRRGDQVGQQVGDHGLVLGVAQPHSPTGTLVPFAVMTRATKQHCSAITSPSIITTATSRPDRSRAISSLGAASVARFHRRLTDEPRPVALALPSSSPPRGGSTSTRSKASNRGRTVTA
jgi:hypothetical protein